MNFRNRAGSLLFVLLIGQHAGAEKMHTIKLKHGKEQLVIRGFRIDGVVDDRPDTGSLGSVLPGLHLKRMSANLEGGAAAAFIAFIARHAAVREDAMPITLHIKKLTVVETQGMTVERVTLTYSYAFYKEGGQILQYNGESYAQTSMDASSYIGKLISESIDQALKKADEDLGSMAPGTQTIEVTARIADGTKASRNIPYSKSRPLTWDDFRGSVDDLSKGAAATYSGISLSYSVLTEGAHIKMLVDVIPAASPERSWFRPAVRNAITLAHEQRHFDITAICACRLVGQIRNTIFTPTGFKEELEALQAESSKLMEQMQDQYDRETSHGRITAMQSQWDQNIAAQLAALSCY